MENEASKKETIIQKFDKFTDRPPQEQLMWWWNNLYKPVLLSLAAPLILGAFLKYMGLFTNFEITVIMYLTLMSAKIGDVRKEIIQLRSSVEEQKTKQI